MVTFTRFEDLAAYLMVSVARVDGNVHYLEEVTLNQQLKVLFPSEETLLERAYAILKAEPDLKIEELLTAHAALIQSRSVSERQSLLEALFGIVNSDGRVQTEEMGLLRMIRDALTMSH